MRFWAVVAALSLSTAIALVAQSPSPSVAADRVVPRPPARDASEVKRPLPSFYFGVGTGGDSGAPRASVEKRASGR